MAKISQISLFYQFYLPKNLVEPYDGNKLRFRIRKEDAQTYLRD